MKKYLFLVPCILIYTISIAGLKNEIVQNKFEINIYIKNKDTGKLSRMAFRSRVQDHKKEKEKWETSNAGNLTALEVASFKCE